MKWISNMWVVYTTSITVWPCLVLSIDSWFHLHIDPSSLYNILVCSLQDSCQIQSDPTGSCGNASGIRAYPFPLSSTQFLTALPLFCFPCGSTIHFCCQYQYHLSTFQLHSTSLIALTYTSLLARLIIHYGKEDEQ